MMDPQLQQLLDERDIRNLVLAYSNAMDARDRAGFRASWADELDLDIPPLGGMEMSGHLRGDDYADRVMTLLGEFKVTQHYNTNHLISVDGDAARCECYTVAQHFLPLGTDNRDDWWLLAGARYNLTARRIAGVGWRFTAFTLTPMWTRGNPHLWEEATRRIAARGGVPNGPG